jgi:hypothetical protein
MLAVKPWLIGLLLIATASVPVLRIERRSSNVQPVSTQHGSSFRGGLASHRTCSSAVKRIRLWREEAGCPWRRLRLRAHSR